MARPLRIEFPSTFYHVTSRGNEGKAVFRSKRDREGKTSGHRIRGQNIEISIKNIMFQDLNPLFSLKPDTLQYSIKPLICSVSIREPPLFWNL